METIVHSLVDHFSSAHYLEVSRLVAHDMHVATLDSALMSAGPMTRVYNSGGSVAYLPIYQYFAALADEYGGEPIFHPALPEFDLMAPPEIPAGTPELNIRDTPEDEIYLRLLSLPQFIGVQTYASGLGNYPKTEGPIVWFDKALPKVRDKMAALDRMICRGTMEIEPLEVA